MTLADKSWLDARDATAASRARRRLLLLASEAELQYRVLRCAASRNTEIHVAGPARARPLALSRYCRRFHETADFGQVSEEASAVQIDAIALVHGIDLVLPSDTATTRLLTRVRARLSVPVFPVPDAQVFDQLATKDRFMELCAREDLPHPESALYRDRASLLAAIESGCVRFPVMFKPVNRAGGIGIVKVDAANARAVAASLDYAPILAQDFIDGEDRSISVFCRGGAVLKEIVYSHPHGTFHFHHEPELRRLVRSLAANLRLDGVINFDARVDGAGRIWLIECNPRFFFSMDAIMVAGLNFTDTGAPAPRTLPREIRPPRAMLRDLLNLRRPHAADWKMFSHWLGDPLMLAYAVSGAERR